VSTPRHKRRKTSRIVDNNPKVGGTGNTDQAFPLPPGALRDRAGRLRSGPQHPSRGCPSGRKAVSVIQRSPPEVVEPAARWFGCNCSGWR